MFTKIRTRFNTERGYFWHIHHTVLVEEVHKKTTIWERVEQVARYKPEDQREIRLNALRPVQDVKAVERAFSACSSARKGEDKRYKFLSEKLQNKRMKHKYNTAAFRKARQAESVEYQKHMGIYEKIEETKKAALEAIHAKECTSCGWDGQTIIKGY